MRRLLTAAVLLLSLALTGSAAAQTSALELQVVGADLDAASLLPGEAATRSVLLRNTGREAGLVLLRTSADAADRGAAVALQLRIGTWVGTMADLRRVPLELPRLEAGASRTLELQVTLPPTASDELQGAAFEVPLEWTLQSLDGDTAVLGVVLTPEEQERGVRPSHEPPGALPFTGGTVAPFAALALGLLTAGLVVAWSGRSELSRAIGERDEHQHEDAEAEAHEA